MRRTIKIAPVTRVEGHLDIEVVVDTVGGRDRVVEAKSSGMMFRAFEAILVGRDPLDATHYTQRICGVCPVSHGMASSLTLEAAFGVAPTDNGRILRNLVLGANFLQSHILHFYHLAALDFIDTTGALDMAPWLPRYTTPDMLTGGDASALIGHYVQALAVRRTAHQMAAIFGGKIPHVPSFMPGGCTENATTQKIADFRKMLNDVRDFIENVYLPDVLLVASRFPEYATYGKGCGNLLAYGVFDLNVSGSDKLLPRGTYTGGQFASMDSRMIAEYVKYSWYKSSSGRNPAVGSTQPTTNKKGAYSWVKAPRYSNKVHEVGALARMWMSGDYRDSISVIGRTAARVLEARKVAIAMGDWLSQLVPGAPTLAPSRTPATATGFGLTEAPRGALGHWLSISKSKVKSYQIVTPTAWNASPKDDGNQPGPIEQALVGTPVADTAQPIEVLRVVHSFDPCLSCAVHIARPGNSKKHTVILSA